MDSGNNNFVLRGSGVSPQSGTQSRGNFTSATTASSSSFSGGGGGGGYDYGDEPKYARDWSKPPTGVSSDGGGVGGGVGSSSSSSHFQQQPTRPPPPSNPIFRGNDLHSSLGEFTKAIRQPTSYAAEQQQQQQPITIAEHIGGGSSGGFPRSNSQQQQSVILPPASSFKSGAPPAASSSYGSNNMIGTAQNPVIVPNKTAVHPSTSDIHNNLSASRQQQQQQDGQFLFYNSNSNAAGNPGAAASSSVPRDVNKSGMLQYTPQTVAPSPRSAAAAQQQQQQKLSAKERVVPDLGDARLLMLGISPDESLIHVFTYLKNIFAAESGEENFDLWTLSAADAGGLIQRMESEMLRIIEAGRPKSVAPEFKFGTTYSQNAVTESLKSKERVLHNKPPSGVPRGYTNNDGGDDHGDDAGRGGATTVPSSSPERFGAPTAQQQGRDLHSGSSSAQSSPQYHRQQKTAGASPAAGGGDPVVIPPPPPPMNVKLPYERAGQHPDDQQGHDDDDNGHHQNTSSAKHSVPQLPSSRPPPKHPTNNAGDDNETAAHAAAAHHHRPAPTAPPAQQQGPLSARKNTAQQQETQHGNLPPAMIRSPSSVSRGGGAISPRRGQIIDPEAPVPGPLYPDRKLKDTMQLLRTGAVLTKFALHSDGKPQLRFFRLENRPAFIVDGAEPLMVPHLCWSSDAKSTPTCICLMNLVDVVLGANAQNIAGRFKRNERGQVVGSRGEPLPANMCVTYVFPHREVNVCAPTEKEFDVWYYGMLQCLERNRQGNYDQRKMLPNPQAQQRQLPQIPPTG